MKGTRILAVDPGTKRMGFALSDELGWTAQPLATYERRGLDADVSHIRRLVLLHEVREVVIGFPLRLDGRTGPEAERVQQLIDRLERDLGVPVTPWDERLTTKAAEQLLIDANMSRKKRKGVVDRVAAAILLQSYLERLPDEAKAAVAGEETGDAPGLAGDHERLSGV